MPENDTRADRFPRYEEETFISKNRGFADKEDCRREGRDAGANGPRPAAPRRRRYRLYHPRTKSREPL